MLADGWLIAQSVAAVATVVVAIPTILYTFSQVKIAAGAAKTAAEQAEISAKAASASALGVISAASRELQWKVLEDEALHPILTSGTTSLTEEMKRQAVRAMLINFYGFVYEFRQLDQIPDTSWQAYKSDMTDFFTQVPNRARWDSQKTVYPVKFQDFVEHEILNRPH